MNPTDPHTLVLAPIHAPRHLAQITAIAGDLDLFTADSAGRILRWRRQGDAWVPSLWRSHGDEEISLIYAEGGRLAWHQGDQLWIGEAEDPDSARCIAERYRNYLALRWSSDGETLYAATYGGDVLGFSRTDGESAAISETSPVPRDGWALRTVGKPTEQSWRYPWRSMISAQLRSDGSAIFRGWESHKSAKRFVGIANEGVLRTTTTFAHVWPDDDETPWAVNVVNQKVAQVGLRSDRGKEWVSLPAAADKPPRRDTLIGGALLSNRHRQLVACYHARYSNKRGWLVVVDLDTPRIRQTELPKDNGSFLTMFARAADQVVFGRGGSQLLTAAVAGDELSLEPFVQVEETPLPEGDVVVEGGVLGYGQTKRLAVLADHQRELFSFDFEGESLRSHGVFSELESGASLYIVSGVLICSQRGWLTAYDLSTRDKLWAAQHGDELLRQGLCAVPAGSQMMHGLDARTGEVRDALLKRPEVQARWQKQGDRLLDKDGCTRARVPRSATWLVDPEGRGALRIEGKRVRFIQLRSADGDPEPAGEVVSDNGGDGDRTAVDDSAALHDSAAVNDSAPIDEQLETRFPPLEGRMLGDAPVQALTIPALSHHHVGSITAMAADRVAFTGDEHGRILRWDPDADAPVLWKLDAPRTLQLDQAQGVLCMATLGSKVAWVQGAPLFSHVTLYVADIASAETRVAITTLPAPVRALRFIESDTILVACSGKPLEPTPGFNRGWPTQGMISMAFQSSASETMGQPVPAGLLKALNPAWRASWLHQLDDAWIEKVGLGDGGEMVGTTVHRENKGGLNITVGQGTLRKTKLFGHSWANADELYAVSLDKGTVRLTATDSDRGKTLARFEACPLANHERPHWKEHAVCFDKDRSWLAVAVGRTIPRAELVVADLSRKKARLVPIPDTMISPPLVAFWGDEVLVHTFRGYVGRADMGGLVNGDRDVELRAMHTTPETYGVDTPTFKLPAEIDQARQTNTHRWMLTTDRRMLRIGFDSPQIEHYGTLAELPELTGFELIAHPEGEVLLVYGKLDWVGYDVTTRRCLWHRALPEESQGRHVHNGDQFGESVEYSVAVAEYDARTGQPTGEVVAPTTTPPKDAWRLVRSNSHYMVLLDGQQQSRVCVDPLRRPHFAPDGSSAIFCTEDGVAFIRLTAV